MEDILFVGLDTDKNWIDVAIAASPRGGEVRHYGRIRNDPAVLSGVIRKLLKGADELVVCYEAGPCGYGIYRQLNEIDCVSCHVIAPSLIPRRSGDRIKTNRRDSLSLAKLLRAEELTSIWVPDEAHEAVRDLVRARSSAVSDLGRCRQRIRSFLLRHGIIYSGKAWTGKHRIWLSRLTFTQRAHEYAFSEMLIALDHAQAQCDRLVQYLEEIWQNWSLAWLVEALQALRGFALINAITVASEIGDPRRFETPRQLMAFVGLVPSEHSTGEKRRTGALTKTGNGRVRKALIEAAWTYARPAKNVKHTASPQVKAIADKARHRLSKRYRTLTGRGKRAQVAVCALAREAVGFIWAIANAAAPKSC